MAREPLLGRLRAELERAADPERAKGAQAYMKSAMPFHGLSAAQLRGVCKRLFREVELPDAATWRGLVLELWEGARFREERYAALELAADRRAREFHTFDALPMFERMIVEGAWWDYVDGIAGHRLGEMLQREPKRMRKAMLAWSRCDDMWKRRASILCQLRFKRETDRALLYACIEPSMGSKEFFLRKAVGWALRQYAWTEPEEVRRYVRENEGRLSALSKREALKNVKGQREVRGGGAGSAAIGVRRPEPRRSLA